MSSSSSLATPAHQAMVSGSNFGTGGAVPNGNTTFTTSGNINNMLPGAAGAPGGGANTTSAPLAGNQNLPGQIMLGQQATASSSSSLPTANTTMGDVINQIHRLHAPSGPTGAQEATQWLMAWQQGCSWEALLQLLQSSGATDPLTFFFAANLLAQKAQTGKSATMQIADRILEFIVELSNLMINAQNGNQPIPNAKKITVVKRQLCVAYADLALYGHASLEKAVQALQVNHYQTMLEMLKIFPEEVKSPKVTVDAEKRMQLVNKLLLTQEQVFDALAGAETDTHLKLQAAAEWLSLPTPQVIASKESGAKFTAEIIRRRCWEHPLLQKAAQCLALEDMEIADAACSCLIALIGLTNEYSELTSPALDLVARSTINLANLLSPPIDPASWLPSGPTSPDAELPIVRMNLISRILAEMGPHYCRALLHKANWCDQFAEVALHWLQIRQVDLARGGLEFWYGAIVSHHSDPVNACEKEQLHPWLEKFTYACLKCTRYPANPDAHIGFETDHFVRFREQCNQCLTEAVAQVLPVSWVIHVVGDEINKLHEWNDLDAAIFILTGVAPRARAGQDNVIPRLIERIPNFPYPETGLPALLLRISAGRLILYTAGYLAFKEEALVPTLMFLLQQLLPSLPKIECQDKDLKQYAQAICTDALRSTTQAAKDKLIEIDNGQFWPKVINSIVELVLNGNFHPDVRPQLVFPVGHIIGAMRDYQTLESTLAQFVQRLEPPQSVLNYPDNREGKGPPELKLYLAALSCCYDIKIAENSDAKHPVLSFWENQWPQIERMTEYAVTKNWEDYVEQFCLSLNFIFQSAQAHAIMSPLLGKALNLLGKAAEVKPTTHYYTLVRTVMGLFAPHGIKEVDDQLVGFLGVFATPVARLCKEHQCQPDIAAACFEMLGDALRWSNLANGSLQSPWLADVFDSALQFLKSPAEIATHEQALTAVLRFFCSFLRWASEGPDVVKFAKPLWEREGRVQELVSALLNLMAMCASNPKATTVGGVAEVIRPMLQGPMEFDAKTCLREGLQNLAPPLKKSPMEAHKLVETMAIAKVDQRRFHKILYDLAENFHALLKRSQT
ncbi:unnamed protein product [Amoebophrya sp. A120]|nr:unnamed protein product [Amoebophrya sp. A120]|eukprot:GSA120T00000427001.1